MNHFRFGRKRFRTFARSKSDDEEENEHNRFHRRNTSAHSKKEKKPGLRASASSPTPLNVPRESLDGVRLDIKVVLNSHRCILVEVNVSETFHSIFSAIKDTTGYSVPASKHRLLRGIRAVDLYDVIGLSTRKLELSPPYYPTSQLYPVPISHAATLNLTPEGIPIILARCQWFLDETNGLQEEGIFRMSGDAEAIQNALHDMSMGDWPLQTEFEDHRRRREAVYNAADTLKSWIKGFPDPLCPHSLFPLFVSVGEKLMRKEEEEGKEEIKNLILDQLPHDNAIIMKYFFTLLHRVIDHSDKNLMTAATLGTCIAPTVFRDADQGTPSPEMMQNVRKTAVVCSNLIEYAPDIFGTILPHSPKPNQLTRMVSDAIHFDEDASRDERTPERVMMPEFPNENESDDENNENDYSDDDNNIIHHDDSNDHSESITSYQNNDSNLIFNQANGENINNNNNNNNNNTVNLNEDVEGYNETNQDHGDNLNVKEVNKNHQEKGENLHDYQNDNNINENDTNDNNDSTQDQDSVQHEQNTQANDERERSPSFEDTDNVYRSHNDNNNNNNSDETEIDKDSNREYFSSSSKLKQEKEKEKDNNNNNQENISSNFKLNNNNNNNSNNNNENDNNDNQKLSNTKNLDDSNNIASPSSLSSSSSSSSLSKKPKPKTKTKTSKKKKKKPSPSSSSLSSPPDFSSEEQDLSNLTHALGESVVNQLMSGRMKTIRDPSFRTHTKNNFAQNMSFWAQKQKNEKEGEKQKDGEEEENIEERKKRQKLEQIKADRRKTMALVNQFHQQNSNNNNNDNDILEKQEHELWPPHRRTASVGNHYNNNSASTTTKRRLSQNVVAARRASFEKISTQISAGNNTIKKYNTTTINNNDNNNNNNDNENNNNSTNHSSKPTPASDAQAHHVAWNQKGRCN